MHIYQHIYTVCVYVGGGGCFCLHYEDQVQ